MKRIAIIFVLLMSGVSVSVNAQRPVGDTLTIGTGDYLYQDTTHIGGHYYPWISDIGFIYYDFLSNQLDMVHNYYVNYLINRLQGQMGYSELRYAYPNLVIKNAGPHTSGFEFYVSEDLYVKGLAACPQVRTDMRTIYPYERIHIFDSNNNIEYFVPRFFSVIDTTMEGRLDEYLQLLIVDSTTLRLLGEGGWRWDDAHRYMHFPSQFIFDTIIGTMMAIDSAVYAPLYEVMFDSSVVIEGKHWYVVAGTHNNNSVLWCDTCREDMIFPELRLCYEHYPTSYTACRADNSVSPFYPSDYTFRGVWCKVDTFPWLEVQQTLGTRLFVNIFPILDTLFGTPCAVVTGMQGVVTDSVTATLMWSADARHHDWELHYYPTDDPENDTTLRLTAPTALLTGLTPGTEYAATVRGRCDVDNYSPWGDTLLFVMPHDTTHVSDTTITDTTFTQGIRQGNLDMFTRIMPNPASEVVNVLSSYMLESVALYDLTGRLVLEQPAEGISALVKVTALPRGTYIMAIRTQQGVATKKLVVR